MRLLGRLTAEAWLTLALFLISVSALAFMDHVVAKPKLLFGRALSAIPPSLFPRVVLIALAIASGALFLLRAREFLRQGPRQAAHDGLGRALALFAIMLAYALAMQPLGFFLSSVLATTAISVVAGNRSILAGLVVTIGGPIGLYLVSTRLLAVSLPELDVIELAWSRLFNLFEAGVTPPTASP